MREHPTAADFADTHAREAGALDPTHADAIGKAILKKISAALFDGRMTQKELAIRALALGLALRNWRFADYSIRTLAKKIRVSHGTLCRHIQAAHCALGTVPTQKAKYTTAT